MPQDYPLPKPVEWMIPDKNVEHGSVDYHDMDAVLKALRSD